MPADDTVGSIPSGDWYVPPASPNAFGMDGPVMSASRMPTLRPFVIAATASMVVTKLFPTPPLPLATAITLPTFDAAFSFAEKSNFSFRSPQFFPQVEQSCVHSSDVSHSFTNSQTDCTKSQNPTPARTRCAAHGAPLIPDP